jgi:hypothetical protein
MPAAGAIVARPSATMAAKKSRKKSKKSKKKYGKAASKMVAKTMRKKKRGTLRSGRSKKKVTSRKQAVAIALSEARSSGAKVPKKRSAKGRKKRRSVS